LHFGEQRGGLCSPVRIVREAIAETLYAACPYFATERWEFTERVSAATSTDQFEMLIFLHGHGQIEFTGGSEAFAPAQIFLLPAALGTFHIAPSSPVTLLRTYVPDLAELVKRLAASGVAESAWSKVVHP